MPGGGSVARVFADVHSAGFATPAYLDHAGAGDVVSIRDRSDSARERSAAGVSIHLAAGALCGIANHPGDHRLGRASTGTPHRASSVAACRMPVPAAVL